LSVLRLSELDALGPVRYIISPNKFHFLDLPDFSRAYPDAKVYVSPQSSGKSLPGIPPRPEEPGQIILSHAPEPAWADDLDQIIFKGMPMVNEVIFFHKQSRTLILTDLCFYIDESTSLLTRLLARSLGVYKKFGPSRTVKMMIRDRRAAQSSLERIMDWDFDRIILAHGRIVESGGKASFGKAFASFLQ